MERERHMTKVCAAAVQVGSRMFDLDATIEIFASKLDQAKNAGADLVVFPEAFFGGYPKGVDFSARVGMRLPEGRDLFARYFCTALARDSSEVRLILKLVQEAAVNVVVGLIERDGGTLYCSVATVNRTGEILSWRRKLMPTAMERLIWGFGDGSTMQVADTDAGRVSTAICWENYMPLLRAYLYSQDPQIHCAPTVDDRDVWLPSMQMIALEGRCFVVSACQFMTRADVEDPMFSPIQGDDPGTILIRGGSCIVSPMGEVLAGPIYSKEETLYAELDLTDIQRGKFDFDVAGHYARPDVFSLTVNTAPQESVTPRSDE
jgi:nitrilase